MSVYPKVKFFLQTKSVNKSVVSYAERIKVFAVCMFEKWANVFLIFCVDVREGRLDLFLFIQGGAPKATKRIGEIK